MVFSVVIPVYNKAKYIQRAISSVLGQSFQEYEIIVVDDGSTDASFEAASQIKDSRIRIFRQENQGVAAARNRGISEAGAEWVAFLDADDEWMPNFLEKIYQLHAEFPECGVLASGYASILDEAQLQSDFSPLFTPPGSMGILADIIENFFSHYSFYSSSIVVKKEFLERINGFPEGVRNGEDTITWMKLSFQTTFAYIDLPLVIYHQEIKDRATNNNLERLYRESDPAAFLKDAIRSGQIPSKYDFSAHEYLYKRQLITARWNATNGNKLRALSFLWECRKTRLQKKKLFEILLLTLTPRWLIKQRFSK